MMIVFDIIAPILALIAIGYLCAAKFGFTPAMEHGLIRFVIDIAVPFTLMGALSRVSFGDGKEIFLLLSYYIPAYSLFIIGMAIAAFGFKRDAAGQVITAIGFSFSNTFFVGLPLIYTAYGASGVDIFFVIVSIHGLGFFTLITILLERAKVQTTNEDSNITKKIMIALVKTPILYGVFAGLSLNVLNIELPHFLNDVSKFMQSGMVSISLLALGMGLTRAKLAGRFFQNMVLIVFKMMIMPSLVFLLAHYVFSLPILWVKVATLLAAMPCGAIVSVYAEKYNAGKNFAATATFMSNVAALVTVSFWLLFLERLG